MAHVPRRHKPEGARADQLFRVDDFTGLLIDFHENQTLQINKEYLMKVLILPCMQPLLASDGTHESDEPWLILLLTFTAGTDRLDAQRCCNARIWLCHWDLNGSLINSLGGKQKSIVSS